MCVPGVSVNSSGGSVFCSKNAAASGGGFYNFIYGVATLNNTTFENNAASVKGGAMYIAQSSWTSFGNTLVQGNTLAPGGTAGPGVCYSFGANFPTQFQGLTDNDDPGGIPVQG
jgi:hypothetical protein